MDENGVCEVCGTAHQVCGGPADPMTLVRAIDLARPRKEAVVNGVRTDKRIIDPETNRVLYGPGDLVPDREAERLGLKTEAKPAKAADKAKRGPKEAE